MNYRSPHKEVRYIVCRPGDPGDLEGEREKIGWYPHLGLAMSHADRTGPGTCVDAEGGTYYPSGPWGRLSHRHLPGIRRRGKA